MSTRSPAARSRDLSLALWQVRYEQRTFWRNRGRALFSFMFPLMFLVIFASIFGSGTIHTASGPVAYNTFFVPGILAYGVISTTYVNMAISTAILRDEGVLKRMQGTPLPTWAYMAGRIGSTILVTAAMSAVTLALGAAAYGVHVPGATLPGLICALLLGTACFTTLGVGIVRFIKSADSAPPIVNLTILPLTFISEIWFRLEHAPHWLTAIAGVFPVRALAGSLQYAFSPYTKGAGFELSHLGTLAIWLLVGTALMVSFLRDPDATAR